MKAHIVVRVSRKDHIPGTFIFFGERFGLKASADGSRFDESTLPACHISNVSFHQSTIRDATRKPTTTCYFFSCMYV